MQYYTALWGRGYRIAERILPEWFIETPIEEVSSEWHGRRWISETWRMTKRPLVLTGAALILLVVTWWFIAPAMIIHSLGMGSNTLFTRAPSYFTAPTGVFDGDPEENGLLGAENAGQHLPPGAYRVDAMGTPIHNPLPLCDLLYSRRTQASYRDELAARISRYIAAEITNDPNRNIDDGVRLFKTNIPSHCSGPRWKHLSDHEAVRPELPRVIEPLPIALNKLSDKYQEAILNHRSPDSMGISITRAKTLFREATYGWMRRECGKHAPPSQYALLDHQQSVIGTSNGRQSPQSEAFATQVAETGAFTVDVTDYIAPTIVPRPSRRNDGKDRGLADEQNSQQYNREREAEDRERERAISEILDVYSKDEDDEVDADATTTTTTTEAEVDSEPLPWPPRSKNRESGSQAPLFLPMSGAGADTSDRDSSHIGARAYRNVSAYELHALMYHLSAQAGAIWMTKRTHVDQAIQMAAEAVNDLIWINAERREYPEGGDNRAMWDMSEKQAAILEESKDNGISEFRARVLWTGETGCVCPHHVGVPIPGAAWTEMGKKTRVLFHIRLPNWLYESGGEAQRRESKTAGDSGSGGGSAVVQEALSWFEGLSNIAGMGASVPGAGQRPDSRTKTMVVQTVDPVFLDIYGRPWLESYTPHIHKIPHTTHHLDSWTWVEGLDFRGQRQRLRVSPTSLSCILSCSQACSEHVKQPDLSTNNANHKPSPM